MFMQVDVISLIPWRQDLTGKHRIEEGLNIKDFVESLNVGWNQETLVTVNDRIVDEHHLLQDGDRIHLLLPVIGG